MAVCRILARAKAVAAPSVAARNDDGQWLAWISCGEFIIEMDAETARQFAAQLSGVCDVIESMHPALGGGEEAGPRIKSGVTGNRGVADGRGSVLWSAP